MGEERENTQKNYIKGTPVHVIFRNEENHYAVLRVKVKESNVKMNKKTITVCGYLQDLDLDESYLFYGSMHKHPRYGWQFHAEFCRKVLPDTKDGVIQYLSGHLFTGIGEKTARNIVEELGTDAIQQILDNPDVLNSVPKLKQETAERLYQTLLEHEGLEKVMIGLSRYGFGSRLSLKIYETYKHEALEVIENDPYQLVSDIEGIGFRRADELGKSLGISGNHPNRIRAGVLYCLEEEAMGSGHVFLKDGQLIKRVQKLLDQEKNKITAEDIGSTIIELDEEGKIVLEEENVYLPSLYFAEKGIVTNLDRLLQTKAETSFSEAEFYRLLGELEEQVGMTYAETQKEAIYQALASPLMILTGGPGTGKTTVIRAIVELYAALNGIRFDDLQKPDTPVKLVAPTGRAAKRMSESTGFPAMTIHRLLGWKGSQFAFEHDRDNPIDGELLVVDEFSMVDIWLANQLFKSLPDGMKVVIVGDEDQLPSVGPGQVLKDLLDAGAVPTVRLTEIYRQAEGSSIVQLAHEIKKGRVPDDLEEARADRRFFPCTKNQVAEVVTQICRNAREKGYAVKDIQVLAPIYRGPAGVDQLNEVLQQFFNPKSEQKRELSIGEKLFRTGDKVLQLVNNAESGIYNGDIGEIVAILKPGETEDKTEQLVVSFDGNEVVYKKQDLNQLTLAYCCSIHKAQGSEFPIVILPVVRSYWRMLKRNLIYTAITRSKDYLLLCGEIEVFCGAISRENKDERHSMLKTKIQEKRVRMLE